MPSIRYEMPSDLSALASCLGRADGNTFLLGGGTDLLPRFHGRVPAGTTLIDLRTVAGLDTLATEDGVLTLGANVTYTRIARDPFVRDALPCLAEMAAGVGSEQIRNAACLPGNLANASPGGDAIGVLMALDATALILGPDGSTRALSIPELVLGIGRTALSRQEAILGVRIPVPGRRRSGFGKLGLGARREVVIANVSLTLVFGFDESAGRIDTARIVVGSAAPTAYRAPEAESLCLGAEPSARLAEAFSDRLQAYVRESIGGNPLFAHKPHDVKGLALDLFHRVFADRF